MSEHQGGRVLAIGLDAAEPTVIERMIKDGELPVLSALLDNGTWSSVESPAKYGSGVVWPTFFTGTDASEHGQYTHWAWDSSAMALRYYDASRFTPFWKSLDEAGVSVGVIDVPFAPHIGVTKGFEVLEWGAHAWVNGRPNISPLPVRNTVTKSFPAHPFSHPLSTPPTDPASLSVLSGQCRDGARLRADVALRLMDETRPDLTIVVFPEVHHGGHFLFHTVEPELPLYDDVRGDPAPQQSLLDLHRELDVQVGRLVKAAGPDTTVLVFGLHGMEPARGVPTVLHPMLEEMGLVRLREDADRRRSMLTSLKARLPESLRNLYRTTVPLAVRSQWGKGQLLPRYDWSTTSAFELPTDQYGWIRINLVGREAEGIVPQSEYAVLCDRIETTIRALRTVDGRPVALDVIRPPRSPGADPLPDLVVHWAQAPFESAVRVNGIDTHPEKREETGQHSTSGFCITSGDALSGKVSDVVQAQDLHRLIEAALGR